MNILFFGPNGSGKGTQGAIVQKQFQIPHIESGVIFRDNVKKGTGLGKKAKGFSPRPFSLCLFTFCLLVRYNATLCRLELATEVWPFGIQVVPRFLAGAAVAVVDFALFF